MQHHPFNHDWRFHFGDPKDQTSPWNAPDSSGWRQVNLPHDWSIERPRSASHPSGSSGGFFEMGRGYYHKQFDAPLDWKDKVVLVEFEGIYMNAEIWLNGHFLARHPYGYTSFQVDLSPYLKLGETNLLKVLVENSGQLNSRWYSGSGIYRPAWLLVAERVHIAPWGVYVTTPQVSEQAAQVSAVVTVNNAGGQPAVATVRGRVIGAGGELCASGECEVSLAGQQAEAQLSLEISSPRLWSPDSPDLYRLETEVMLAGQVVDRETTSFGIRSLVFNAEQGFLLNGRLLKLKGGCVHHDNGVLGSASYPRAEARKVELHKASGYNAIRCAHNPPAPAFLDACDRLGMLVIDEAFDCWREGKNFFDYHVSFDDWWQRDLNSMLLRDRNHPSIILWSIGNEVLERDRPEGAQIAQMLANYVRAVDPTRPVTSAICGTWTGKEWSTTDATFAALDVGGYNYQWKQYEPDHVRFPQRLMAGTESFPLEALDNWQAVEAHPYVLGDFVWTSLDYLGESGIGHLKDPKDTAFLGGYPWHQANCGDIDLCGFKRPQSYYRDMVWGVGTQLYFAVHTPKDPAHELAPTLWGWHDVWPNWNWAGHEGERFQVEIYSACEAVELFVNGQSLGKQPVVRHSALFEVPYQPGELRAVGYQAGQPACEASLKTTGPAAQLRLTSDRAKIQAETGDLCYITVELTDANGLVHPVDDRLVRFSVQGPADLVAVGSSNPMSEEDYCASQRSTYRGRGLAVVRSNGAPGTITLQAEAEGMQPGSVEIAAVV